MAGAGYGLLFPPLTAAITTAVAPQDLGIAGAASSVGTYVGMVLGIQLHQTVQESREAASGLLGSYREAFLTGAVVAVVGTIVVSRMRSLPRGAGLPVGRTASISVRPGARAPSTLDPA
jgi:hypothetical protein